MGWSDYSEEEKGAIYKRRYVGGDDVSDIAEDLNMNPITLNRRLQEMRSAEPESKSDTLDEKLSIASDSENNMTLSSQSSRITSLDELLKACSVDLTLWKVDHWVANTWEGYRKNEVKNLTWVDGAIQEGAIQDDGGFSTTTMFQVKAWLVRSQPIAVQPVIRPVNLSPLPLITHQQSTSAYVKTTLVIPDMHIGFKRHPITGKLTPLHDRKAISLVLDISEKHSFDNVVLLGDNLDLADWSDKFLRTPDFEQATQPAIEELAWFLWQLRSKQTSAHFYYIEGNHERRLRDMIAKHIPQAYGIRPVGIDVDYAAWSIPNLLGLDAMQIDWVGNYPEAGVWLETDLYATHGIGLSAEKVSSDTDVSVIFGHIHRFESASRAVYSKFGARVVLAYCPGFLGRMDGVIPAAKPHMRWSQGFAIVSHADGQEPSISHIPVTNGIAIFDGNIISGSDYVERLKEQVLGYNF